MSEFKTVKTGAKSRRTLGGLISIYESNYIRMMRLAPELDHMNGAYVSRVAGALDLYLSVLERFKFTTTLCLTYRFQDEDPLDPGYQQDVFEPRARIRIYHDARAVEVISHCRRKASRTVQPWSQGQLPELDRKWELNRFLQKWLGFCHRQGHLFLRCTSLSMDGAYIFTTTEAEEPNRLSTQLPAGWRWDPESPL
jgi:uncharacterized protein YqiB (DUF1249 family)